MKRYIVGIGEALWDVLPEGAKLGGGAGKLCLSCRTIRIPGRCCECSW